MNPKQLLIEDCHASGVLRHVALVRTNVSEECITSIIKVTRSFPIGVTLSPSETSVLPTATWHNIPEDNIFHNHQHENLKSYKYSLTYARRN
jgi:hypothetical protein